MKLEDLGYNGTIEKHRVENNLSHLDIGRVVLEHKERYVVITGQGECDAEITGNMRFSARSRKDFPAVGDWVALTTYESDFSIIHNILPRTTTLLRQAPGQPGGEQIIAANIDYALLVQAIDRDFNINRFERYLTLCFSSAVKPIIVLTKTDLISDQSLVEIIEKLRQRIQDIPVFAISNETLKGFDELIRIFERGKTYCLLGSSGVGKSTLLNNLKGRPVMKTGTISQSNNKGKHVTSHRELTVMENGGVLIDNPGMREVGIIDTEQGLEITFDIILRMAENCKFSDCTHTSETGCRITDALNAGEIDQKSFDNYIKMQRERAHFDATVAERRRKDKEFGKMVKNFKKGKKRDIQ